MAKSQYDYVRAFESDDRCLPNTWLVVRIDGNNFHAFSQSHNFAKPNDARALGLMNASAKAVLQEFDAAFLAYGQSDEYSFVFRKNTSTFSRRASKLSSNVVSRFTAEFVWRWAEFFPDQRLISPPWFDSRVVLYPSEKTLRDYLSWRQVDCHINNLYNTTFWSLVLKGGLNNQEATQRLSGTLSGDKNEILFSQFDINYNNLPQMFRKGTTLVKTLLSSDSKSNKQDLAEVPSSGIDAPGNGADNASEKNSMNATPAAEESIDAASVDGAISESDAASNGKDAASSSSDSRLVDKLNLTPVSSATFSRPSQKNKSKNLVYKVEELNCDIIKEEFWRSKCRLEEFGGGAMDKPGKAIRNVETERIKDFEW